MLLIDGNLRNPIHRALLGGHADRDLGSVLTGKSRLRDSVWPLRLPVGECHSIGAHAPLSVELLSSEAMRRMLLEARVSYDFVVVDAPSASPARPLTDAQLHAKFTELATRCLDATAAERLYVACTALDTLADCADLPTTWRSAIDRGEVR